MIDQSMMFFFFFSSRRRHTRLQGDWSSDVCSSDLPGFSWWVPEGLDGSVARSSRGAKACFRAHLLRGEDGAFLGSLGALVEHREQPHAHEADGHGDRKSVV